jgi:hypothetical protein
MKEKDASTPVVKETPATKETSAKEATPIKKGLNNKILIAGLALLVIICLAACVVGLILLNKLKQDLGTGITPTPTQTNTPTSTVTQSPTPSATTTVSRTTVTPTPNTSKFASARNMQRETDVMVIMNSITQYVSEQGNSLSDFGVIPSCSAGAKFIGTGSGNIDLGDLLVSDYLVAVPTDPLKGSDSNTGYTICSTTDGRIEIAAPHAELGKTISYKR